jgi:hypothetical protein
MPRPDAVGQAATKWERAMTGAPVRGFGSEIYAGLREADIEIFCHVADHAGSGGAAAMRSHISPRIA